MKKKLIYLISIISLLSCKNPTTDYSLGKNISEVGFKMIFNCEPTVGKEICTLLYFENSDYKIVKAYHSCENYTPKDVDAFKKEIKCGKKLYLDDDTVKICLIPGEPGIYKFHKIKLLFVDKENTCFVADTTFSFNVRDSI